MDIREIQVGKRYFLSGDIENGYNKDGKPVISHEEVTRFIKLITDTHIICECDRKFLINQNLQITER